jgi:hypothetical protein
MLFHKKSSEGIFQCAFSQVCARKLHLQLAETISIDQAFATDEPPTLDQKAAKRFLL